MTSACGGSEPVFLDTVGGGGPIYCPILCDYAYEDDSVMLMALTRPCIVGAEACTTCDACHNLLAFHANQRSCDDGLNGGRVINVEPVTCYGSTE